MARKKWCGRLSAVVIAALFAVTGSPAHAANREVGGCIQIRTAAQLQAMKNNLAGIYCLMKDIDAGSIANFTPVGTGANSFFGRFDGNGHVIRNLTIANTDPATEYVGLFGLVESAVIEDVSLINADVSSNVDGNYVGTLIGRAASATIQRVFGTGKVHCSGNTCIAAGLIGLVTDSDIVDAWSSASVRSVFAVGGLIGVSGGDSWVRDSYATGDVICNGTCILAGGFSMSFNNGDMVRESFATGKVQCSTCISGAGGFVGVVSAGATLANVYATGAVIAGANSVVGGLIGSHGGTAVASFAAGPVQGGTGSLVGGLIGSVSGAPTVIDCYWDTNTTGQMTSAGGLGTGRTMAQVLPARFGAAPWAIAIATTKNNPFLISDGFSSNLATLVRANKIYTALPIMQSDKSQYLGNPKHANVASLATVYTMVARAIGQTLGVPSLDNVRIDRFFWRDAQDVVPRSGYDARHDRSDAADSRQHAAQHRQRDRQVQRAHLGGAAGELQDRGRPYGNPLHAGHALYKEGRERGAGDRQRSLHRRAGCDRSGHQARGAAARLPAHRLQGERLRDDLEHPLVRFVFNRSALSSSSHCDADAERSEGEAEAIQG
jgi:hypothetical protein